MRRYAGIDESGNVMGIPLITESIDFTGDLNYTRNTYEQCVEQIIADLDIALSAGLPDKYEGDNDDFGITNVGRPTTVACKALKSRVLLYAASPAFATADYSEAAQAAYDVIQVIGSTLPDSYNFV